MAWLTIPALVGPIIGPPLGGFLTTYLSWHWIFWINVPIGIARPRARHPVPAGERAARRRGRSTCPGFVLCGDRLRRHRLRHVGDQPAGAPARLRLCDASPSAWSAGLALPAPCPADAASRCSIRRCSRYPLFRAGILGGSLFRIGIGAIPFLMPLMLQLGFGLNPFESGLITFIAAVGAIASKFGAQRVFQPLRLPHRARHRRARLGAPSSRVNGLFTPATPLAADHGAAARRRRAALALLHRRQRHGLRRRRRRRQRARRRRSTRSRQQISLATGVALAGGVLDIAGQLHGGGIGARRLPRRLLRRRRGLRARDHRLPSAPRRRRGGGDRPPPAGDGRPGG